MAVCLSRRAAQEPSLFMLERKADDPRMLYYFFQEMRQGRSRSSRFKAYSATAGRKAYPTRLSSTARGLAGRRACRVRSSHRLPAPVPRVRCTAETAEEAGADAMAAASQPHIRVPRVPPWPLGQQNEACKIMRLMHVEAWSLLQCPA